MKVGGRLYYCSMYNMQQKHGHNRTKQQQHLIASHVAPTETEREMPQGA